VSVEIFTATSANGLITPARGESSLSLIGQLAVPPEVLAWQADARRDHDVVLVGTDTVLIDDPALTSHASPDRPGARATVDPHGRIPPHARFLDGTVRTLVGVTATTPPGSLALLAERGVEPVLAGDQELNLAVFLGSLAARGLPRVLVEGGGRLNRSLLAAGLVDRLHLLVFPAVLDATSVNVFDGPGPLTRLHLESCRRLGSYLLLSYRVLREVESVTRTAPSPGSW
jgi:riboflavin-specific deaminase-like protein